MSRKRKIFVISGVGLAGFLVLLLIAGVVIIQTSWFSNYVRQKIVSSVEDATGGRAELQSFRFHPGSLTVDVRGFVLHGREPATAAPLARVESLQIHLGLFSGIAHLINLSYIRLQTPQISIITFPDGTTNIPEPKVKQQSSSNGNALQSVVDLKIGKFEIRNGLLSWNQRQAQFDGQGENLYAVLGYHAANPGYTGRLSIQPLMFKAAGGQPLNIGVNLPIDINGNTLTLRDARLTTPESTVGFTVSLRNLNQPVVNANLQASLSLPELRRTLNLALDTSAKDAPLNLTAQLAATYDQQSGLVELQTGHVALGSSTIDAVGRLRDPNEAHAAARIKADVSLTQLSHLLGSSSFQSQGNLAVAGSAGLDAQNNYRLDANVSGNALNINASGHRIEGVSLSVPVHADPNQVRIDGLRVAALGGTLQARVLLAKAQQLTLEGALHGFDLSPLSAAFLGQPAGYDGVINGTLNASADLKTKRLTDRLTAAAHLTVDPVATNQHRSGVPLTGSLNAKYSGASGNIDLANSYLAMPHSRLDLSGTSMTAVNLKLSSRNLNDFRPLLNLDRTQPPTEVPVQLGAGGNASVDASIAGALTNPKIAAHAALHNFNVQQSRFDSASVDAGASSSGASLQNGALMSASVHTTFQASLGLVRWKPLPTSPVAADLTMRNAAVSDILALAGESGIPATGAADADVHINGTYGDPLGAAKFHIDNGTLYQQSFRTLQAQVNFQDQLIALAPFTWVTDAGTLTATGNYHHPRDNVATGNADFHVESTEIDLGKLKHLQDVTQGLAGIVHLEASGAAGVSAVNGTSTLTIANLNADLSAQKLELRKQSAGNINFSARTEGRDETYQLTSNFAGSTVNVRGRTSLDVGYRTVANADIDRLSLTKTLLLAGEPTLPISGTLSLHANVNGPLATPEGRADLRLTDARVYDEKIQSLTGSLRYSGTQAEIPSLVLTAPAGTVTVTASLAHPASSYSEGTFQVSLKTNEIDLAKIEHVHQQEPTLAGTTRLALDAGGKLVTGQPLPALLTSLNAHLATDNLQLNSRPLGTVALNATTSGSAVKVQFNSDLAQSKIHAESTSQLTGQYPTSARISFSNISYANVQPFLEEDPSVRPTFDASVDGNASLDGPLLNQDALTGRLELTTLSARSLPLRSATGGPSRRAVGIKNQQPIIVSLRRSLLTIEHCALVGDGTNVSASGSVSLKNVQDPMSLQVNANVNLGALQDVDRDFYSSGQVDLTAAVHGTTSDPLLNGRVELKNANINYAESPNGLSNANGVILLSGKSASIQNLTAETGGGKITASGFAAFSGRRVTYNLKAAARKVRVRYSSISVTSNADIALTGNTQRSLLNGTVTVSRIAYNSSSDVGSLLSRFASTPPSTPTAPSPLLAGMRLDIRLVTAPDVRVITTYADRLSVEANLSLRGTAISPGMLGRITVTEGQLVFFGNTYNVNTGTIGFFSPSAIQPVLNISLSTLTQGVDVTLTVSGPVNNMQLTYTSDPPLTFEQIVSLLATNTTPSDPNIAANQPQAPQQSFTQMGESAILGQAVADPLASRVQRVFGLSQFKIDPTVAGSSGPSARVTLQQKIANNITFTYITDVTQTNSEIIRVQWDLTPKFSAVGLRDYNGNVSLEFFYKFKAH